MESLQPDATAGERPPTKLERVLAALIERPCTSRELELSPVFDHVAPSTVADLRRLAVEIQSELIEIVGYAGLPARVARYSIPPAGRAHALEVLLRFRARRCRGRR